MPPLSVPQDDVKWQSLSDVDQYTGRDLICSPPDHSPQTLECRPD
jgi:hypothetical protein